MKKNHNSIYKIWRDQRGIASIEYVLLLAFVGAGIIAGAGLLKESITGELTSVAKCIGDVNLNPAVCE